MNKKRRQWRLFGALAALCAAMLCGSIVAQADGMDISPNRSTVGTVGGLSVPLGAKSDTVKNIKVYKGSSGTKKTSDLIVDVTSVSSSYNEKGKKDGYQATIQYYAKKTGTYRIQYDIYKKSGQKRKTCTQKVAVSKAGFGINMLLDGKKADRTFVYTDKKSAKLKFTADPGCKIKKITMNYMNSKGKYVTKKFNNGSKLTFSKYGTEYSGDDYYSKNMWTCTCFAVTYTDSYYSSKKTNTVYYYVYNLASKWVKETY